MRPSRIIWFPCAALAMNMLYVGISPANQIAIDIDTSQIWITQGGGASSFGWQFSTKANIEVTALGVWDYGNIYDGQGGPIGDGLITEHPIAIWNVSDPTTPLVSSVIPSGTAAQLLDDGFRYVYVNPTILPAGGTYAIAAKYYAPTTVNYDNMVEGNQNQLSLQVAPDIEFDGYRLNHVSIELAFPDIHHPEGLGLFGPNFAYCASVPDGGGTLVLLGLGLATVGAVRRKKA